MWKKPGKPIAIDVSQLTVGLFVELAISWDDHPFLTNRFRIGSDEQVRTIRSLPVAGKLFYYPDKSTVEPLPLAVVAAEPEPGPLSAEEELQYEIAQRNRVKRERQLQVRDSMARADRAWEQAARVARSAMLGMAHSPKQAGVQLQALSQQTAKTVAQGSDILLHLLGDKQGDGPQFHALNTMTLAMLLGKTAGLDEAQLADLALGMLAHDIGKAKVPQHILRKRDRARHEEDFYRQHGAYGVEMAVVSGAFSPAALAIVAEHHEYIDGSGWPRGKRDTSLAVRIASLVDRYDRLCSPESPEVAALMPTEALARIYKAEVGRFDSRLLGLLIKLLGVFPPGTLVRLNDDSLGLVVAPGRDSLRPVVLIYSPETDKDDAPTLDLGQETSLKVEEAIRPSSLAPDVLTWLNPRQRLSYFFSAEGR